jgi:hypothetical protein
MVYTYTWEHRGREVESGQCTEGNFLKEARPQLRTYVQDILHLPRQSAA